MATSLIRNASFVLLLVLFFYPRVNYSQNNMCASADPFCTGTTYNFPAGVNAGTAESGPSYSCLGSEPNPAWYYLQIANSGPLEIHMVGGNSTNDIDFCCWGPFPNLGAACGSLSGGASLSSHHAPGACTWYPSGNVVDCSYDISAGEWCYIPNGVTGQVYMLMITNYSNSACNIVFSQSGGTGSTDCSILAPPITNNGPLCVGQTLNLTVTNPTPGATYNWTGPGGFTSTTMNPSIPNVTMADTGTYSMTITVNGQTSAAVTTTVVVNSYPIADAGLDQSICLGDFAILTASGGGTYIWSTGDSTATITDNPAITYTYTVTVSNNGCAATDSVVVTVNPLPRPVATTTPASCGLSNGSATATAGDSYLWNDGQTTATASNLAAGNYSVTVTDANGCTASTSCTVSNNPGNATVTTTDAHCGHNDGTATVTISCGIGNYTYLWDNGDTTNTRDSLVPGTYTVTVSDGTNTTVATGVVGNQAGPSAYFLYHPNPVTIGQQVLFTSTSMTANNWQWDFGDSTGIGSGQAIGHTYYAEGDYSVTLIVTDAFGCSDTLTREVMVHDIFTIYIPNAFTPNGDGLNDFFQAYGINWEPDVYKMIIFDRWGNIVYQTTDPTKPWNGGFENNPSRDSRIPGVYVYSITVTGEYGKELLYMGKVTLAR